ncbi:MAG: hypothetical protein WCW13_00640 [archaeon]|jgi:SAM-dependent methyltransferase
MRLSHSAKVARKKFRRAIVSQFGARKPINKRELALYMLGKSAQDIDSQIARQANPGIQQLFYPAREKPYPLDQIGHDYAKVPKETVHNFVPLPRLAQEINRVPQIQALIRQHPELNSRLEKQLRAATRERGIKASKFWVTADKEYIDRIAAAGKGNPNRMNQIAGERIAKMFGDEVKPRTILDIGTFAGGTVKEVVAAMKPKQRALLKVVLVDVAGEIVKKYAVHELEDLGVLRENIKVLPVNFYNAAVSLGVMPKPLHEKGERTYSKEFVKLIGKVDAVTAGAATINFATDLKPYLRSVKRLLKSGGMFVNWDWGSAEVRSPSVNVPALKKAIVGVAEDGKKITHYDAYISFLNFWMRSYGYPPQVVNRMIADINASTRFDFTAWAEKNRDWMEHARQTEQWVDKKTGATKIGRPGLQKPFGYRNRAYRLGSAMQREATRLGLSTTNPEYPIAKPGELNTGNLNWLLVMRKK